MVSNSSPEIGLLLGPRSTGCSWTPAGSTSSGCGGSSSRRAPRPRLCDSRFMRAVGGVVPANPRNGRSDGRRDSAATKCREAMPVAVLEASYSSTGGPQQRAGRAGWAGPRPDWDRMGPPQQCPTASWWARAGLLLQDCCIIAAPVHRPTAAMHTSHRASIVTHAGV